MPGTITGPPLGACVMTTASASKLVYFGFPFQTTYQESIRESIMSAAVSFLDVDPGDFIFSDEFEIGDTSAWQP